MAVRKKDDRWVVEFALRGTRVFKRLPNGASKANAKAYEAKLRQEIISKAVLGERPKVTIGQAIEQWLTDVVAASKSEKQTTAHANACASVVDLPIEAVADAAQQLKQEMSDLTPATINRRLCVLKAAARHAWKLGWTEFNLSPRIETLREGPVREVYLTRDQLDKLIDATPEYGKAFVALAAFTGLRQGEVMALTKEDVQKDSLRVRDSKTGLPRLVPLVEAAKSYTRAIPFTQHKRTLYAAFEDARKAIGMPTLHYHDLRHTTASLMIQAGVPIFTVGEILGHRSIQTTKRYAHLALEDKAQALNAAFPKKIPSKSRQGKRRK